MQPYLPKQLHCLVDKKLELFGVYISRSSRPELSYDKGILKSFAKF